MDNRGGESVLARTVAENVRARRAALGWTQAQLAERAGLPTLAITRAEQGRQVPKVVTLLAIADALLVELGDIVKQEAEV